MALEETSSPPAQPNVVNLPPPNLRSPWAYLAVAFVIISMLGVIFYAAYSCHYSQKLRARTMPTLPRYAADSSKTKQTKKKAWRPSSSKSSFSQHQPILFDMLTTQESLSHISDADNETYTPPMPTFPTTAVSPPTKPSSDPTYDMHNIRFASPSNLTICANPKLAPVQGSAIPLSYASQDNVFVNLFTPATVSSRKEEPEKRSRMSAAFRKQGRTRSYSLGKENYKVLPGQVEVPM
ncbi:hypothetical protein R3P38DRAFT_3254301 [Favolaschia claudopus]|uniref:Uncharacterized protein n=1 Tax=Favolaschia claudopus TaxID=2862362 RepID=A0AAW0DPV5_9AGAR